MKNLLLIVFVFVVAFGASAQYKKDTSAFTLPTTLTITEKHE